MGCLKPNSPTSPSIPFNPELSTVQLFVRNTPEDPRGRCTGFYVSSTHLLTAAHCAKREVMVLREEKEIFLFPIWLDYGDDVALLGSETPVEHWLAIAPTHPPSQAPVTIYSRLDSYLVVYQRHVGFMNDKGLFLDGGIVPGMSGSPVVHRGLVVSIATQTGYAGNPFFSAAYGVPLEALHKAISKGSE